MLQQGHEPAARLARRNLQRLEQRKALFGQSDGGLVDALYEFPTVEVGEVGHGGQVGLVVRARDDSACGDDGSVGGGEGGVRHGHGGVGRHGNGL